MSKIKLGQRVKDPLTGYEGVAVARTEYLNGCARIGVQAPVREGKVPNWEYFDEMQLKEIKPTKKTGGPRPDPNGVPDPR